MSRGPLLRRVGPRLWAVLVIAATLTCGDGGTDPVNKPPSPVGTIPDQVVAVDSAVVVDARPYFADPDGDTLAHAAASSGTATAAVAVSGSMITVTGVAAGSATVTVTARDPEGLSATQVFGVTVPNRAPVATLTIADRSVYVDGTVTVDASEHFTDPDGDPLAYSAASSDASCAAVDVVGTTVTVTGVAVGSAAVTVTATDPGGLAAEQVFEVTVPNRAPLPVDTIEDREVEVDSVEVLDVAAFFSDPDRDSLAYSAATSDATRATVGVSGSVLSLTGVASGAATVTVTATDPGGLAAMQVFGVAVPNRPPLVTGRIEDREVHVDDTVVADLSDYFEDPDGDVLQYEATSRDTARASVTVSGSMLGVSGVSVGSTTVTVAARDTAGLEARQSLGVTIPNRAPVAVGAIADREVEVDSAGELEVEGYFSDPDGQVLEYSAVSSNPDRAAVRVSGRVLTVTGVAAGRATVTVRATDPPGLWAEQSFGVLVPNRAPEAVGAIGDREFHVDDTVIVHAGRYFTDPDGEELRYAAESSGSAVASVAVSAGRLTLVAEGVGDATVTVTARDPGGLEAEQRFRVTVPNRPPEPVGTIANPQVEAGTILTLSVPEYFRDPDRQKLRYSAVSSDPARATAAVSGRTLTVKGVAKGSATVTVTATDPGGLEAEQRFRVTVPNRPPVAVGIIADREAHVGDTVEVVVTGTFADPDGDALEYAIASSDTTRVAVSLSDGVATVLGAGVGGAAVRVTARDPEGLTAVQRFAVTVPNRPPEPTGTIADREVHVGEAVVVDVAEYFTDPDGEELAYAAVSSSTETATARVSGSAVTVRGVGVGSLAVTVTARDPGGLAATLEFRVGVPNRPPGIVGTIEDRVVNMDSVVAFDVTGYFADPDGHALDYSAASSDPATAAATVAESTVTLESVARGTATVTLTARDPGGLTAQQVFEVLVPNRPPVAVGTIADREVRAGDSETVDAAAFFADPDGDELWYDVSSSDDSRAAVEVSGTLVTVWGVAGGSTTVAVIATDQGGLAAGQVFEVTVPNRAPEAVGAMEDLAIESDAGTSLVVSPYFADPDGDELTYDAASSRTAVATVEVSGDTVAVTAEAEGTATITVTARDQGGLTATQRFDVTVLEPNLPPESVGTIPDRTIDGHDEVSIDVEPYFTDPDGDDLEYSGGSSDEVVATVELEGSSAHISGHERGEATITVTATDPGGLAAVQKFDVEVPNRAPYVAVEIDDLSDATPGEEYTLLLTDVFVDPDGDSLGYTVSSSDADVAEPELGGDTIFVAAVGVGTATVTVTATDSAGLSATDEFEFTVIGARFDLWLGHTADVTDTLLSLIRETRREWEAILLDTELSDVTVPDVMSCLGIVVRDVGDVDDHLVLMDVREVDGVGGTLAYAGYCYRRSSDGSPIVSAAVFDKADLDTLVAYGTMQDVIFHEIAHGLGFTSRYWNHKDLLETGDDPHFMGELAVEAFDDAGGEDYEDEKVPISSPDHSHWRKSVFGREGMTPSLKLGVKNPFSAITLQAMADVDYEVDVSLADDYDLPGDEAPPPGPSGESPPMLDLSNDVAWTPVTELGPDGRIIRVIRPPRWPGVLPYPRREARLEDGFRPAGPAGIVRLEAPKRRTMWRLVRKPGA